MLSVVLSGSGCDPSLSASLRTADLTRSSGAEQAGLPHIQCMPTLALVVSQPARQTKAMSRQDQSAIRRAVPPDTGWRPAPVVLAIILLTCSIELVLVAADHGVVGTPRWRSLAYQNGAFWTGLLNNWRPNYPAQPWLMFLTYQGLHASFMHLIGNMIVLFLVGRILVARVGQVWFAALYVISGIGGGLGFALLTDSAQPMVGASGALFGLVGAWKWQDWFFNSQKGYSRKALILDVVGLAVLNLVLWIVQDGQLAWEAHLGGFLTGWLAATLIIPHSDPTKT